MAVRAGAWRARAIQRAVDAAGERYAEAFAAARADEEERVLEEILQTSLLGTYCVAPQGAYALRLRIALVQAHRMDVVGFRRTYELAVKPYIPIPWESFEQHVGDLFHLLAGRAGARRYARRQLERPTPHVQPRLIAGTLQASEPAQSVVPASASQ